MSRRREVCASCGRHVAKCGDLSHTGRCLDCSTEAASRAAREISAKCGAAYEAWLRAGGHRGRPPRT